MVNMFAYINTNTFAIFLIEIFSTFGDVPNEKT